MTAEDLLVELAALADAVAPAVEPAGTARLLEAITDAARQLFGAHSCSLALLSDDEEELVYTTVTGEGAESVSGMRIASDHGVAGWVAQSGQPVAINDLRSDGRFASDIAQRVGKESGYIPTAILAVPVTADRLLGVLSLFDRDTSRSGAEKDMALLGVFADQAAIALESAQASRSLGRVLLSALADAATAESELLPALDRATQRLPAPEQDLADVAGLLGELRRSGPQERQLAVRLLREVLAYSGRRSQRPDS